MAKSQPFDIHGPQAVPPAHESRKSSTVAPQTEESSASTGRAQPKAGRVEPLLGKPYASQQQVRRATDLPEPVQHRSTHLRPDRSNIEGQSPFAPSETSLSPKPAPEECEKPQPKPPRPVSVNSLEPETSPPRLTESRASMPYQPLTPPLAVRDAEPTVRLSDIERVIEKAVDKKAQDLLRTLKPPRNEVIRLEPHRPAPSPSQRREEPQVIVRTERVEVVRPPDKAAKRSAANSPRPSRASAQGRPSNRSSSKLRFGLGQM